MKYCAHCGKEIMDEAVICPNCGCSTENLKTETNKTAGNALGWVAIFVGFFIPLVAWICGGIGLSKAIKANNQKGKTLNLIGLIVGSAVFILTIIIAIIFFSVFMNYFYYYGYTY